MILSCFFDNDHFSGKSTENIISHAQVDAAPAHSFLIRSKNHIVAKLQDSSCVRFSQANSRCSVSGTSSCSANAALMRHPVNEPPHTLNTHSNEANLTRSNLVVLRNIAQASYDHAVLLTTHAVQKKTLCVRIGVVCSDFSSLPCLNRSQNAEE